MKEFDAYCKYCQKVVKGKATNINALQSGNYLYIGECITCLYEVRRIVTKSNHIDYPESWYRQTPKGMDVESNTNNKTVDYQI